MFDFKIFRITAIYPGMRSLLVKNIAMYTNTLLRIWW